VRHGEEKRGQDSFLTEKSPAPILFGTRIALEAGNDGKYLIRSAGSYRGGGGRFDQRSIYAETTFERNG